jgi:hypothetical protein
MLRVTSQVSHDNVKRILVHGEECRTIIDVHYAVEEVDPLTGERTGRIREVSSRYRFTGKLEGVDCGEGVVCKRAGDNVYTVEGEGRSLIVLVNAELGGSDCGARVHVRVDMRRRE